ncbi:MAG: ATP-binding cassette domain-containing protein [Burkholderiales bacterium]|nr:ATP-binding cassette domain-containing protein [Burkholderiales bacterium]
MRFDIDIGKEVVAAGRRFSLAVRFTTEADRLALFGPSGAGKSLTLACIAGLVTPDRGRIAIDGDVWLDTAQRIDIPTRDRRVGFVFQDYALFPHRTVEQNVAAADDRGYPRRRSRERQGDIDALLALFALDELRASYPEQLSGGQRQRVALARALLAKPRLLLLDEPFAALDAALRQRLRAELVAVQQRFGVPMLLITHDPDDLAECAQQVVTLAGGRVAPSS